MEQALKYLQSKPGFFLLAGPCVIEGEEMAFEIGHTVRFQRELQEG